MIFLQKRKQAKYKNYGKKIWWAKVIIEGKEEYLDNYYTEMEAANTYHQEMECLVIYQQQQKHIKSTNNGCMCENSLVKSVKKYSMITIIVKMLKRNGIWN
ncbi:MAG: hypothetical protein ACLQG5_09600 [Methanobacterium sp.]|jgi:hypothetical protein